MSVLQLLKNLFTEESQLNFGVAHSGSLNVESGFAEIKTQYFPSCDVCSQSMSLIRDCKGCGRKKGNNLQFLAGRGDGVYSGITFYSDMTSVLGVIYVFDEDTSFATALGSQITGETLRGNTFQEELVESLKEYLGCDAFEAGTIHAEFESATDVGFILGDPNAFVGSQFATVDHPFANGVYNAYLFMEPILASPSAQTALALGGNEEDYTLGYSDAMRPRVLFMVNEKYDSKAMRKIKTHKVNWAKQAEVWSNTLVAGNMTSSNAGRANVVNGLAWLGAANDQEDSIGDHPLNEQIWYLYSTRAFGYFIQAALCGDEVGLELAMDQANSSEDGSILEQDVLTDAIAPRGLNYGVEVLSIFN